MLLLDLVDFVIDGGSGSRFGLWRRSGLGGSPRALLWRWLILNRKRAWEEIYGVPHQSFGTFAVKRELLPDTGITHTASGNGVFIDFDVEVDILGTAEHSSGFLCATTLEIPHNESNKGSWKSSEAEMRYFYLTTYRSDNVRLHG